MEINKVAAASINTAALFFIFISIQAYAEPPIIVDGHMVIQAKAA